MPASYRFTSTGACCSCGAYGGSQHRPTCQPDREGPRIELRPSRRARRDARNSAAVREYERIQRSLVGDSESPTAQGVRTTKLLSLRDLDADDRAALRDLVRYGVMADDQIARRYAVPAVAYHRLPQLKQGGIVFLWREAIEGARCYSATSLGRHLSGLSGVMSLKTRESHLAHDVAVVDLADVLVAEHPDSRFITERELRAFLDSIGPAPLIRRGDNRHRPDGLLLTPSERIAIELEHSDKYDQRYYLISRWFAREWRLDRVRWYVDNAAIISRLRQINAQHGFDRDIQLEIQPFPTGVRLRRRLGKFEP